MAMSLRTSKLWIFFAGLVTAVSGFIIIYFPQKLPLFLFQAIFRLSEPFFHNIYINLSGPGLVFVLFGTFLMALSLFKSHEMATVFPIENSDYLEKELKKPFKVLLCGMMAIVCVTITLVKLSGKPPEDITAVYWLMAIIWFCLGFHLIDRYKRPGSAGKPNGICWQELLFLGVIANACLWLTAFDITHWRWAGTPDEAIFYITAKWFEEGIMEKPFILSEDGVFGYHPVLSTYFQIMFMKIFGMDILGWRLSSAFSFSVSVPFLYLFVKAVWTLQ